MQIADLLLHVDSVTIQSYARALPSCDMPVNGWVSQLRSHTNLVNICEHSWRYLFRCWHCPRCNVCTH